MKPSLLYDTYQRVLFNYVMLGVQEDRSDYVSMHEWLKREHNCKVISPLNKPWILEFENEHDRLLFLLKFSGG